MEIAEKILQGDIASASRLITMIENSSEEAVDALKIIFPRTGNAYVVGITGAPGGRKKHLDLRDHWRIQEERPDSGSDSRGCYQSLFRGGAAR